MIPTGSLNHIPGSEQLKSDVKLCSRREGSTNLLAKIEKDNWIILEGKAKKGDVGDFDLELCRKLLDIVSKSNCK